MMPKNETKGDGSPIILDSKINYYVQVKYETVMNRKNNIYIPLMKELKEIIRKYTGDFLSKIEYPFLKEVLEKQYEYRLDDELLNKFCLLSENINKYNKNSVYNIAGGIVVKQFKLGFTDLYGDIIDGQIPIIIEDEVVDFDYVLPEEFDNINLIAYDEKHIKKLIDSENDFDFFYNDDEDYLQVNKYLLNFYEFALASRNKHNSPARKLIIDWKARPEEYIAYTFDFFKEFNSDIKVIDKKNQLNKLLNEVNILIIEIDNKLKDIFEKYEKE